MIKEKLNVLELMHTFITDYDAEISPNEGMLLYAIQHKDSELFADIKDRCKSDYYFKESIEWLLRKGIIINNGDEKFVIKVENLVLSNVIRLNMSNLISAASEESTTLGEDYKVFNTFVDIWYELWPKGVRPNGYLVRSGKKPVYKKLLKFTKEYPEYSQETILEATNQYVKRYSLKGYSYMKTASYFVYKDGESVLAGECERIETQPQREQEDEGVISSANTDRLL